MPVAYAPRPLWAATEARAGVIFHKHPVGPDGSIGPPRYWHHAAGRWDALYYPLAHVRELARPLAAVARSVQAFAVPEAVAIEPAASATLVQLDDQGEVRSVLATIPAADLAATATLLPGLAL